MYNNFSSKKTKKVISALLASALVVTSAPITANAATAKVLGVGKSFTVKKTTKVSGLSKAEKKIVKVTVNKKKRTVTVKGVKAGKATFKIGKKAYTIKVGATSIAKKTVTTSMTAGETKTLSVKATNGKGDTIQFTSSKKGVVKVNKASVTASKKTGVAATKVTAVAEGTAKITAKSKYTGKSKTFTIKVVAATPAPASQAPATVAPSTGGGVSGTATTAPTATAGTQASATPGTDATQNPDATPGTDATQAPGADATEVPGTDATQAPSADATEVPGTDATQAPEVPVAKTGTITVATNVTGASIKVISGTSVVAEVTTDDTTTSATFPDLENGEYVIEVSKVGYSTFTTTQVVAGDTTTVNAKLENAKVVSVKAKSKSEILVKFNAPVDAVAAENFKVEGATVKSATLSADKKAATVEVSDMTMGKEYNITITGLTSNGVALAKAELTYEAKEVDYEIKLSLPDSKQTLCSDGKDAVLVTATIYDEDGDVADYLDKVEVEFKTTAGNFAETRVTVQNGKATNMLTSESSSTEIKALISATVVSTTDDYKNILNKTDSKVVLMTPTVADSEDETVGATLIDVKVETADRVILYFNKNVDVADYTEQDTVNGHVFDYDSSKMKIEIRDNAPNAVDEISDTYPSNRNVLALAPVKGNSKALCAILDVSSPNGQLTDNSKVVVKVSDFTGNIDTNSTKTTLVSDIRVPSILGVENDGLTTLKVTFSEPVQTKDGAGTPIAPYSAYVADVASHWKIDGTALDDDKYGVAAKQAATVEVGEFDVETGDDYRNIVTITLGQDKDGKQLFFTSGSHSIQGNNIGDWANLTDNKNNIINIQTLDFTIDPDNTVPTAEVKVESPEQYTVTFNKPVSTKEVIDNLVLQKYDTTYSKWEDKTYSDERTDTTVLSGDNGIIITPVGEKSGVAKEYVVEVTKDWTRALDTEANFVNYYNNDYRLFIKEKMISNPSNGLTNADIILDLNDDIMKKLDATSPEIVIDGVKQVGTKNQFTVTMSEPVQVANLNAGGIKEVITPSQTQNKTLGGVQYTTVTFVSEDGKTTVPGQIDSMKDAHDTEFVVSPQTGTLSAGTWRIVITGLSDDYGNTIATRSDTTFEVKGVTETVDTTFKVQWIVAVPQKTVDTTQGGALSNDPIGNKAGAGSQYNDMKDDIIYVKFNKKFKTYGGAANAVSTTNYTVNGYAVPTTSKIDASVKNYNDIANTKNKYTDLVAIHLPAGTLTSDSNTVNISSTIEAFAGGTVSNYGMKNLDKNAVTGIFTYNYKTINATTDIDEVDEIKKILANSDYVNVTTKALKDTTEEGKVATTDLTIGSVGTYTFASTTNAWKSLTIKTDETGTITVDGGKFDTINVVAPNAEVVIEGSVVVSDLNLKDIMSGTLVIKGASTSIGGSVVITDTNGGSAVEIANDVTNAIDIDVDTTDSVVFDIQTSGVAHNIDILKAADITFDGFDTASTISVASGVTAKDVTITYDKNNVNMGTALDSLGATVDVIDEVAPTFATANVNESTSATAFKIDFQPDEEVTLSAPSGVTLDTTKITDTESETTVTVTLSTAATAATAVNITAKDAAGNATVYVVSYDGSSTWSLQSKADYDKSVELTALKTAFASFGNSTSLAWGTPTNLTITAGNANADANVALPQSVSGKYTIAYTEAAATTGWTLSQSKVTVAKTVADQATYNVNYTITSATDSTAVITGEIIITADAVAPSVTTKFSPAGSLSTGTTTVEFSEDLSSESKTAVKSIIDAALTKGGSTGTVSTEWTDDKTLTITVENEEATVTALTSSVTVKDLAGNTATLTASDLQEAD